MTHSEISTHVAAMHDYIVLLCDIQEVQDQFNTELAAPAPDRKTFTAHHKVKCECCGRMAYNVGDAGMCYECDELAGIEEKAWEFNAVSAKDNARAAELIALIRKLGGKPQFDTPDAA